MSVEWKRVEDTTWPVDVGSDECDSLEWRLRYAPQESLTRGEILAAASILAAYRHIGCGRAPRDSLLRVRKAHSLASLPTPEGER